MVPAREGARTAQLKKGALPYCVLALLAEQPSYGFDLVRRLSQGSGLITTEGTIYPLLSRLRREKLIASSWQKSTAGPPRRYYHVTAEGEESLRTFIAEWEEFRETIDSLLQAFERPREGARR